MTHYASGFHLLIKNILLFILLISSGIEAVSSAEVVLKGLAIHEELRVPVYFAATSGTPPGSAEEFKLHPQPFKVEARYIVEKFSARRNNRLWMNAILVGNSRQALKEVEQSVLQFSQLIRFEMRKGDQIVFDIDPTKGTNVSLNGIALGLIKDIGFQSALINIWFSERQTTKIFAEQIRSKPNSKMLKEFHSLTFQANRLRPIKALQEALVSKQPENFIETDPTNNQQANIKPPVNQSDKRNDRVAKIENKKITQTQNKSVRRTTTPKQDQTKTNKSQTRNDKTKKKSSPVAKGSVSPTKVAKTESDSVVDQILNTLRSDYQIDLKEYFEKKSRPIPPVSIRRKPNGRAVMSVSIRKEKNKMVIVNTQIQSSSFAATLDESIHQSVKRLSAIPNMPDALKEETIIVDVTLDFARCRRATSAWICF